MRIRAWLWTPIALVALAASSFAAYRWLTPPPLPPGLLYGSGRVEGTEVAVTPEISGRVIASELVEGAPVRTGQALVRLDDADVRVELDRARADRSAAQREWDRLQRELRIARHHLETARVDDARYAALARDGTISTQRREQASNALVDADGRVATLLAAIEQARARVTALDNTVRLAESRRDKAVIVAPMSGTVLIKSIEIGELATPGRSIATLVDLTRVELRIYVPEGEIGRIRLGDPARVRTDAFPDRYLDARVARVDQDAQFTPRDIHVPDERTRLVFGVTLEIDNADGRLKPGMPADAWVRWDPSAAWPEALVVPK